MPRQPSPSHPVASTRASDPAAIADLLPAAQAIASGELEDAAAALRALPEDRLSDPPARLVRALLAWRSDELAEAIAILAPAHEAEPGNGSYAEVLATLYALVGNLGESLFLGKLATGMGLDETLHALVPPDFPTFGNAFLNIEERPLVAAARNAVNRDRPEQAVRLLRDHLELFPDDQEAWQELVRLLLELGRVAEAEAASAGLRRLDDAVSVSLLARARCAAGAHGLAAGSHDAAALMAEAFPGRVAEIAGARVNDFWWCAPEGDEVIAAADSWVSAHCPAAPPQRRRPSGERLTVGFLVAGDVRPDLQVALAQIGRAFNRQTILPLGYGLGSAGHPRNGVYRNAFVEWRDIRDIDPMTLARIFSGDGIDVLVDVAGYGYVPGVQAVAQSDVPLRLLWAQLPMGTGPQPYDARLTAGEPGQGIVAGLLPFALSDAPVPPRAFAQAAAATGAGGEEGGRLVVGCDLQPRQASREMLALLAAIAQVTPGVTLAIRDNGFSHSSLAGRLIDGLGDAAGAVQLVQAEDPVEFSRYLDLAIAPILPSSAVPVLSALSAGCPVVTLERDPVRNGGYAALLQACGLSALVATDPGSLIRIAGGLLLEPDWLAEARQALQAVDVAAIASPARLADGLEQAFRRALTQVG